YDPAGVVISAAKNTLDQFTSLGLREVFLTTLDQGQLQDFKDKIPASYLNDLLRTRIFAAEWVRIPAEIGFASIYSLSTIGLLLLWIFWPTILARLRADDLPRTQIFYTLTVAVTAIVLNAMICGALSG